MPDGRRLPQPGSATEMYLAAVYDRLGELLDRLPPPPAASGPPTGQVELREPAPDRSGASGRGMAGEGPGAVASGRPARPPAQKGTGRRGAGRQQTEIVEE